MNRERDGAARWLVVLRADGKVDAVEDGAPASWVGRLLPDDDDAPRAVRQAAAQLVAAAPRSVRRATVRISSEHRPVEVDLVLVEALPVRRAATNLRDVALRTLDVLAAQAEASGLELTVSIDPAVPELASVDGEKLAWALSTLLANALRYAKKTVRLVVRLRDEGESERDTEGESASAVVVEIVDDGPGMPEQVRRWLFEHDPATGKSAGLALLLVRDIVAAHRGTIAVTSVSSRGTTFAVTLPVAPPLARMGASPV